MGVPQRPVKPTGGASGTAWVAGADVFANELNEDILPLYTTLNAGVDATNLAANPAIPGTAIADAPSGIATSKINNNAVTDVKLASGAIDSDRAVGASHIKDDVVGFRAFKITTLSLTASGPVAGGTNTEMDTGLPIATTLPILVYQGTNDNQENIVCTLRKGGSNWIITFYNPMAISVTLVSNNFKIDYIDG